ncbi:BTAD domain-containing putative transcriptional regulator [Nonomuraea sp. NPDC005501]|uniref:BTAD domain-containing putative transcriptional regulator n=1 Tax=Nonomuraea sp. NPDC005501 TaxID=3156884 RepID=UPI0033BB0A46
MRFGVLGPLAVWTDAGESVAIPGLKVRALLADLLVSEGHVVSADRLVDDLWSGEPPGNPAGALQVRVSQLRRALEDAEPGAKNLVVSRAPGYLLSAEPGAVDAARFTGLVARAEAADGPRATAALLSEALGLWRGPAFADFADEEFTRSAIVRLEEQRLAALERHAEARLELGEHGLLAGELGEHVALHPLRERLRAVHMRALYRAGRQSEALASYAELRERLAEELGLDPGPELAELHQAILGQDPALSAVTERPATNLPAPVSRLIGRDDAITEVATLLADHRLVTLTGSGGVGKTRLALEVAHSLSGAYTDGAWLVELASLDRATGSPAEAVMEALGIREGTDGATPAARLAEVLRTRETLLVLDNCEHVVDRVADVAGALLRAVPRLRVLATSREPLSLPGEVLWSVPPLDVPDLTAFDAVLGASPGAALAAAERSDAVRLFVARAAASTRGFTLDAGNAEAVVRLCRRLDGIPLALELAATRVRALGLRGVVARLDDRFRLLASGHRGAPPRQQTLTAVIDWSWELLTPPERVVLRRLAVHADGCTLEAAQEVCAGDRTGRDRIDELAEIGELDVLDLLARLVDRSLVVVVEGAAGVRYRLLESVAEYCLDRLADAGELESVRRAHARHHLALAEQAEPALYGHDQREWLQRLDAEAANLRAALETAARGDDAGTAIRLVNALSWYWYLRGRPGEARRSLETALALHGDAPGRARAAAWRAGFALMLGDQATWDTAAIEDPRDRARAELFLGMAVADVPTAQALMGGALTTFRSIGDEWGIATVLSKRARDAFTQRDVVALERDSEESVRLFDKLGDQWGRLQALEWLGGLAEMRGDGEGARLLFEDGLRVAEELGLWNEVARRTAWLGWGALQAGAFERAMELCGRALRLSVEQGFREGKVMAEMGLAFAARRAGRFDLAERHLLHLLEGVPRHPGAEPALHLPTTLVELGYLRERQGDAEEARKLHLEALAAAQRVGDPSSVTFAVEALAAALAASGSPDRAARLLGLAAAAHEAGRTPATPSQTEEIDRVTERVREALGEEGFAALYEEGSRLKLDDAPGLAL